LGKPLNVIKLRKYLVLLNHDRQFVLLGILNEYQKFKVSGGLESLNLMTLGSPLRGARSAIPPAEK